MSGGVDSSVAASLLAAAGHDVVGATLKLWGGDSDSGCCSVSDVDDARRVADQIGVAHHVFNFTDEFDAAVVAPYVEDHAAGRTPNPCIECNRHIKFGTLLGRARRLGFDMLATGHHARVDDGADGRRLRRGADRAKDQSYVLSMLTQPELAQVLLPVGALTKAEVRAHAARLGLRTAFKPDSQDVCFIQSTEGRRRFLADRVALHRGQIVDADTGLVVGSVPAVELVTVGQRRGLGVAVDGRRLYALEVNVPARRVLVGRAAAARGHHVAVCRPTWIDRPLDAGARILGQTSAHGHAAPGTWLGHAVEFDESVPLVAPGQTVALYDIDDTDTVAGSALAA
jgi:tRNA-specific 2-thiouridylase